MPQQYHHHQQQQSHYSHHSKHQHYSNHHQLQNQQYIYSKPIYEDFAEHGHNKQQRRDIYEKMEKQSQLNGAAPKALKKSLRRSESNEIIFPQQKTYAPHSTIPTTTTSTTKAQSPHQKPSLDLYSSPQNVKTPKVAGYRVIRQIIPGPNSTQADIEKVLSRGSSRSSTHPNSTTTNTNNKNNNNEVFTKNTLNQTKHSFVMKGGVSPSYGTMIRDSKREQPIVSSTSNSFYNSHSAMHQSPFRKTNNTDYGSMNRSNSIDKF